MTSSCRYVCCVRSFSLHLRAVDAFQRPRTAIGCPATWTGPQDASGLAEVLQHGS